MSLAVPPSPPKLMTAEEFFELPDDGTERDLIDGRIIVWGERMTARNRVHCRIEPRIAHLLQSWLETNPDQGGAILSGEAGFRLKRSPDSLVGIDVAYASEQVMSETPPEVPYFDGPPVLAVEILSPSDKLEQIVKKVRKYLEAGSVVWVVNPDFRTVSVHRPGQETETFNARQELVGGPELPGLRLPVSALFS